MDAIEKIKFIIITISNHKAAMKLTNKYKATLKLTYKSDAL